MWTFSVSKSEKCVKRRAWLAFLVCAIGTLSVDLAEARFASRFSLATTEEYNDNVFFRKDKTHDFVTVFTPALHFLYQPRDQPDTSFTATLTAPGEIYARNPNLTNMGDRFSLRSNLKYLVSPKLTLNVTECVGRIGKSRISGGGGGGGNFPTSRSGSGSTGAGGIGQIGSLTGSGGFNGFGNEGCGGKGVAGVDRIGKEEPGSNLSTNEFIQSGETLSNSFETSLRYSLSSTLRFEGRYGWNYLKFIDSGGYESGHTLDFGVWYSRWQQHNLKARYRVTFLRTREGRNLIVHDVDAGDDFFTTRQINLTPTLSIWGSTGVSLATGEEKFRLLHKLDVALVKLWRTALFTIGAHRGLGASYGIAGAAYTTDFFTRYVIRFSQRTAAFASAEFSLYDTQGSSDFETFQAVTGVQYWISSWLSANLVYQFRRFDAKNAIRSKLLQRSQVTTGAIDGNSVVLSLAAYFDLWPNFGFGRGAAQNSPLFAPAGFSGPAQLPGSAMPEAQGSAPTGPANP